MIIKDAASIVLVDSRGQEPRILMGKRAAKHKFMPNIYVFPGGRVIMLIGLDLLASTTKTTRLIY